MRTLSSQLPRKFHSHIRKYISEGKVPESFHQANLSEREFDDLYDAAERTVAVLRRDDNSPADTRDEKGILTRPDAWNRYRVFGYTTDKKSPNTDNYTLEDNGVEQNLAYSRDTADKTIYMKLKSEPAPNSPVSFETFYIVDKQHPEESFAVWF